MSVKKLLKSVLAFSCAATMAVGLTSCVASSNSAYDIAVKNGFQGTEQEWLASLQGSNGQDGKDLNIAEIYEEAKANGFTGTFLEFLSEYFSVEVQEDNDTKTIARNTMSVVSIYCGFTKTTKSGGYWGIGGQTHTEVYSAAGSGVIIDLDKENGNAIVLTNYHVIYDAACDTENGISDSIYLYTHGSLNLFSTETGKDEDGDGMKATYLGGAMDYDVAVLSVSGQVDQLDSAEEAVIGNSDTVQAGEKVFAIGNPDGAGISVTSGVVSVPSEYITMSSTDGTSGSVQYRVMRTDAAINHGNSGGALFNARGELIGITNAKNADDEVDNMGYALPISQVICIKDNALANEGKVMRAMLGVEVTISESKAEINEHGQIVIEESFYVSKESTSKDNSSHGKLAFGDEFISITLNGETQTLTRRYQLNDWLLRVRKGDVVVVKVLRGGVETEVSITFDKDSHFVEYA